MKFYTVKEVAIILKKDNQTIRRYEKKGDLKGIRVGGSLLFKKEDLEKFIENK